jgi:cytidine deaminase
MRVSTALAFSIWEVILAVDPSIRRLAKAARGAARRAYAPYSEFRVGAALLDAKGRVFTGANIENAAYPLGICAERTALQLWRSEGGDAIEAVVVFTDTDVPTPPCGLCREALQRWAGGARLYLIFRGGVAGPSRPAEWLAGETRG